MTSTAAFRPVLRAPLWCRRVPSSTPGGATIILTLLLFNIVSAQGIPRVPLQQLPPEGIASAPMTTYKQHRPPREKTTDVKGNVNPVTETSKQDATTALRQSRGDPNSQSSSQGDPKSPVAQASLKLQTTSPLSIAHISQGGPKNRTNSTMDKILQGKTMPQGVTKGGVLTTGHKDNNTLSNRIKENLDLETMVRNLQTQLKESQGIHERTRSVLNLVQEKQVAQEQDLQTLKDEILQMKRQRQEDRDAIMQLEVMVGNNNWGIADLKASQQQLKLDHTNLKVILKNQNQTFLAMENLVDRSETRHSDYIHSISQLRREMLSLRTDMGRDRGVLRHLNQAIQKHLSKGPTSVHNKGTTQNKVSPIPAVSSVDVNPPIESSGEPTTPKQENLEEKDNMVEHNLNEIKKHEKMLKKHVEIHKNLFLKYDAEISKLYTMFFNLSLQMTTLEKTMLIKQQQKFEGDLGRLQQSFLNFSQQMFQLEQWHMATRTHANASQQNQREIGQMGNILDNHTARIKAMETLILDQTTVNKHNYQLLSNTIAKLNASVTLMRRTSSNHDSKAKNVFQDVDRKLMEYNMRIRHNGDRLAHVEVQVFNASLARCQKTNQDLLQNMKLTDFERNLQRVEGKTNSYEGEMGRLERGLSRLYQDNQSRGKTVDELLQMTHSLNRLVPEIVSLRQEVNNFVIHLPRDCSEQFPGATRQDGLYLIKPDGSARSARTFCQVDQNGVWTVIQQRFDGAENFERPWKDYKLGFGFPDKEFWIGNDNLHYMTTQANYTLRIDMWDERLDYTYAEYQHFQVDSEADFYKLHVSQYRGNATDALIYSDNMAFSTIDRDNDVSSTHCAKFYTSGWWYKHCHYSNLNGRFRVGIVWFNRDWDEWVQMKRVLMRIKRHTTPPGGDTIADNSINTKTAADTAKRP